MYTEYEHNIFLRLVVMISSWYENNAFSPWKVCQKFVQKILEGMSQLMG